MELDIAMIGKLRGKIDSYQDDSVILDVSGVGYQVFCSARTLATLPEAGQSAELMIETHVREEHIHLLGFPTTEERNWFRTLTSVQGVGVKMALAILGVFTPAELAHSIASKDIKSLTRVSGVGQKLAERITTELKNKIAKLPTSPVGMGTKIGTNAILPAPSVSEDAISALINLGYNRAHAYTAVTAALSEQKETQQLDAVIKDSLRYLTR